jgi:Ca-activated chloride channel family protein
MRWKGAFAVSSAAVLAASSAAVLGASALALAGQQGQPTFRSGIRVVSLFVTVIDAQRRLVPDLVQDDFEVLDNDKPQPIVLFESVAQPITVVVMLDTSGSMTGTIGLLRQAAEQFLIRLFPGDKAKVGAFNDKIQVSSSFSSDRDDLISEVKNLDYGNGTRLYDALLLSLDELKGIEGRRVVLVFTDGDDTASHVGLGPVIERGRVDEVMMYSIGLESSVFNGQHMIRTKPDGGLKKISDETGGGYFELKKTADLSPTFTRVAQELHSQYVIGFTPTQLDGKVHRLTVRLKQPGMTARARRSYVASADKYQISEK